MYRFLFAVGFVAAGFGPAVASDGDVAKGERIYERCIACHSIDRNRTGPKHCGLLGRPAGSVPGFKYSRAMTRSGIVWTRETLDAFLRNPRAAVPRTRMGYAGVKDAVERRDLIAYLAAAPECE